MLTTTATVTVNSAFLREIKEDSYQLLRLFARLRAVLSSPRWWDVLENPFEDLLCRLRDQVAMHFALEEFYGYFDNPQEVAPRLSERVEALRRQHEQLYLEICYLAEEADKVRHRECRKDLLADLGLRFRDFDAAFQYHEACENELLLEAFDDDIGVGD
jgi:hypothetical protein